MTQADYAALTLSLRNPALRAALAERGMDPDCVHIAARAALLAQAPVRVRWPARARDGACYGGPA